MHQLGHLPFSFRGLEHGYGVKTAKMWDKETPVLLFLCVALLTPQHQRLRMGYCDNLPSAVRPSSGHTFERLLLWNPWAKFLQHFMWSLLSKRKLKIYRKGHRPLIKMTAMPIYGETLKIFFSRTKKALRLNLCIEHWGLKVYQIY